MTRPGRSDRARDAPLRVNVGCGATPTGGWVNVDNSPAARLARWAGPLRLLAAAGLADRQSARFAAVARTRRVRYADAARRLPCPDSSADALYSCHMVEHLDRREAAAFLREARRVLRPGGVLRLVAPDLARLARDYLASGDADAFMAASHLGLARPAGLRARLRAALTGPRHHLWMYDGRSLCALVSAAGFADPRVMPPGQTRIAEPGRLDLAERAAESVCVEAVQPG